ncbi:hypothetical protein FSST1_006297 [Fusarium sambucinum]
MNNAQPVSATTEPVTRHACEPCRRKKTKCTAERPICSYCKRLGDKCYYLPRGRPGGMTRRLRQHVPHDFFNGQELAAASFYSQVAEEAVREMADEGIPTTELVQALCLITLKHYKTQQLGRAWMTTGTAVRLEAMRLLSSDSASGQWEQSSIRISWLVHVLERFLVPPLSDTSRLELPDHPDLTRMPPPPHPSTTGTDSVAIISHSMRITTIWGELRSYLHKLRQGNTEKPWSPDSTHTRINLELITFESNTPKGLFLCNAHLSSRTRDEVCQNIEYWNRFMVGQIMWHAIHAILNHPFIHLFLLASRESIPLSCFFLQQRIDTAVYHFDPMVADAIAGTATVAWLFQFSKDQKIAQDAQNSLVKCESFLSNVAKTWPHVSNRMDALRKLRVLAQENNRRNSSQDTTISFHPAWFWDILAPKPNATRVWDSMSQTKSEISLKSHFVLPLDDETDTNVDRTLPDFDIDPFFLTSGALELFNIDSLSHDFFQIDPWDYEF